MGSSGGNMYDSSVGWCCSGTLGALVEDAFGARYILSNNHVLARTNSAPLGDGIIHPGLIDQGCSRNGVIAQLTTFEPLLLGPAGSPGGPNFVDAAIAMVTDPNVASDATINSIGDISTSTVGAFAGQAVQKSGRTTGHTTGTVSAVGVTILVGYSANCGEAASRFGFFSNQILISNGSFSGAGDSGSLIVENVTAPAVPRAVGLLFARTSSLTVANPIDSILPLFDVSMVGVGPGGSSSSDFLQAFGTQTDLASATQQTTSQSLKKATIVSLTYDTLTRSDGSSDLSVTIRLVDDFGRAIHNAHLGIIVDHDGALYGTGTGAVTNSEGETTYTLTDVPDGTYTTTVTYLDADGFADVESGSTPQNAFQKGFDATPSTFHILNQAVAAMAPATFFPATIETAAVATADHGGALLSLDGVVGHGIGISDSGWTTIEIFVEDESAATNALLPASLNGIPCNIVVTGLFEAF
ncbi:MAG: hypothetical protein IIB38_03715 [Candidatus Hydrogenedentes bacterium]|nr:hypothetical protein [Candidatus Hydrogenedentota bacterium]